jgi:hypothetical protein
VDQSNARVRREVGPRSVGSNYNSTPQRGKNPNKRSVVTCTSEESKVGSLHTDPNLGRHDNIIREKVS